MYKGIIFDVGGVLHKDKIDYVYQDIKRTLKLNECEFNNSYKKLISQLQIGKIPEKYFWKKVKELGNSGEPLPETSLFLREYVKRFAKNKDVLLLVKRLKEKRYKSAIISNTIKPHVSYCNSTGLYNNFDVTIFSNEVGLVKPDPRIYKLALKRMNLKPSEVIFIDDVLSYVKAAEELGITGILFSTSRKLEEELKKLLPL